ncbi:MAG: hypothetical protein KGJ58_00285 [Patescibacteria group bacterium]|nr:hypothetical protein [Patescibacteria group bacterium]MDE2217880.1 hypothetical protein [Patescibacteria group bacterium]
MAGRLVSKGGAQVSLARNLAAAESEGGQKFYPVGSRSDSFGDFPLTARPRVQFGARSAPSVPFKKGSDFVK